MRIAGAQINYHIGNFEDNVFKVKAAIRRARDMGADLAVFAELAVSGYPPRDFLEFDDFIEKCMLAIKEIAKECVDVAVVIGGPTFNPQAHGKKLYNTAFFLADGAIKSLHHKSLLPNYDVFDEYRYFEPNKDLHLVDWKGKKLAITICEDLWNIGNDPMYTHNPMDVLFEQSPDVIINIAASPFHYDQAGIRKEILKQNVNKYKLPLFYVNHVGAQTELLFDGGSMAIAPNGKIYDEFNYFEEDFRMYELDDVISSKVALSSACRSGKIELIHKALVMGIRNYFMKLGFQKAILGLSGGIDSAVTLVLAAEALGKENIYAVLMPSEFSSEHSVADARKLAENMGCAYDLVSIQDVYNTLNQSLDPLFKNRPFDITEENLQARVRGVILMALSNKFGYILLNTSNKSEAAVGYGTLYGDMNGGLSVLGDVYKTEVFALAEHINRTQEIIPRHTIDKPPSAELRPHQKDSDSLPEYETLDQILYQYIEKRQGPNDLIKMGFDEEIVRKTLRLVNTNEYKRHQTPPILRVSPKAFGMGRRMPIVARYLA